MSFEKHVFISYAHLDNQTVPPNHPGWITRFESSLQTFLDMRLGKKAEIWWDDKLNGNDIFSDEIIDQFPKTALLVSIVTPRYLNSEWCTREVEEFCKAAQQGGGVVVSNKSRIFKVIKLPVKTLESLPAAIKTTLGYDFFTRINGQEDGAPIEVDPVYGEDSARNYNLKIAQLAWDASQLIEELETNAEEHKSSQGDQVKAKTIIYLAECGYDRREAREILKADLQLHGYTVLPDKELPREEMEYVKTVEGLLERCTLSIHLVGDNYGAVPDGPSEKSVVIIQNELTVKQSKSRGLQRLIWLPDGTHSKQPGQQAFIEGLQGDAELQFGADLVTGNIEELKTTIHTILKKLEQPASEMDMEHPADKDGTSLVYLICDQKDRKATVPLRKFLREAGFEVELPVFEGDASAVRAANQKLLTTCHAVIVFYGAGDEAWKRTIDSDLKKMNAYRSGKRLAASCVYLAEPKTSHKEDLIDMDESGLINGLNGFSATAMEAFIQAIAPDKEAP